jgi:hypothetical protein
LANIAHKTICAPCTVREKFHAIDRPSFFERSPKQREGRRMQGQRREGVHACGCVIVPTSTSCSKRRLGFGCCLVTGRLLGKSTSIQRAESQVLVSGAHLWGGVLQASSLKSSRVPLSTFLQSIDLVLSPVHIDDKTNRHTDTKAISAHAQTHGAHEGASLSAMKALCALCRCVER